MSKKKTIEQFILEAKLVHGDRYDYSESIYTGSRNKITIYCKEHGYFDQIAYNHIKGHKCFDCMVDEMRYDKETFITKANIVHNNFYDYSNVEYIDSKKHVEIICPIHKSFYQQPSMHLSGQHCPDCANDQLKLKLQDFIDRANIIHNNYYDYSKVVYINNYTKVEIICPIHKSFFQQPDLHLCNQGCPSCKISKSEKLIIKLLKENNIEYINQKRFDDCRNVLPLPFDFYLPELNITIEFQGKQHYEPIEYFGGLKTLEYIQKNDKIKVKYCKQNKIKLLKIKYNEDITKKLKLWNII